MALYNTSNVLDNSIFLKARLEKNMVGDNYYIENLQERRNADWEYRYNVVDIEEELNKPLGYTKYQTCFTPIEAIITNVKGDKGRDLGSDWASISFKDFKHPSGLGYHYRFSVDNSNKEELLHLSEEDKHYALSVWLGINKAPIKVGNSVIVRRCNSFVALVGSPTLSYNDITEVRYEPVILENNLKYTQIYQNQDLPVPQGEWYMTMQLNYFTNQIKLNDRFMFGTIDEDTRENNQVYAVKGIVKSGSTKTFARDAEDELATTPLLIIALDKVQVSPEDDLVNRIPSSAPMYKVSQETPTYQYYIQEDKGDARILVGDTIEYEFNLYYNKNKVSDNILFDIKGELKGIIEKNWNNYFSLERISDNKFAVHNLKPCNRGHLELIVSCKDPDNPEKVIVQGFEVELGGFY